MALVTFENATIFSILQNLSQVDHMQPNGYDLALQPGMFPSH